ncbi:MAG: pseudouridine synthase [Pseudomonadota bacterium]
MTESQSVPEGERIAKLIARAGVCSRREAETLVTQGRVAVDGETLETPAVRVRPGQRVTIDGELLPAVEHTRLWRLHKPRGILTTAQDPEGRQTIYDGLPADLPRVMPVGRLDLTSEGLLLLTNDGGLKRQLELPATGWLRRYRVRVFGSVNERDLASLADGLTVDGVSYGPVQARLDSTRGRNSWLTFALREGKNREIRKLCEHLGYQVNRLIRVAYGPFQLGNLKEGHVEEVPTKILREQLGNRLPQQPEKTGRPGRTSQPAREKPAARPVRAPGGRNRRTTKP